MLLRMKNNTYVESDLVDHKMISVEARKWAEVIFSTLKHLKKYSRQNSELNNFKHVCKSKKLIYRFHTVVYLYIIS